MGGMSEKTIFMCGQHFYHIQALALYENDRPNSVGVVEVIVRLTSHGDLLVTQFVWNVDSNKYQYKGVDEFVPTDVKDCQDDGRRNRRRSRRRGRTTNKTCYNNDKPTCCVETGKYVLLPITARLAKFALKLKVTFGAQHFFWDELTQFNKRQMLSLQSKKVPPTAQYRRIVYFFLLLITSQFERKHRRKKNLKSKNNKKVLRLK